ncbi:putative thiophen / furan oxidation protein [Prochlorococcus marinus str. MIT 9313]|uniref:tRNA modification GTPase MnmE n=2 Tax=Prochlorococcus marinus TaxID=1219 RepID=MNME_PROMM|nr:tRNA uridine-5-carboxymethylaminomethyl(34) synthesis GTPase MnmE [Prochlorococcus marinus]Q7V491.1 RecName: Full=tRNA modification GTPase MnmE [Prochlorococcus marinus str. MIT 9313]CAE22248.1 putative thiophen / furan oxidation protein [Prochlorococcus marinus str. MIT 9313]
MMSSPIPHQQTIAAVATAVAPGQGGIAVVRLSGPAAEVVGRSVVSIPGQQLWVSHRVLYGHVMDESGKERIDEVLVLLMKGPRSFTGEDVVEIHCHGGLMAVQRVLERVLAQPHVRRALPGEFSQRAVLNGRLDLTQAEAISELVAARSRRAAQLAMTGVDGGIQRRITSLRERLLDQLSELEARVDFEEDLPPLDGAELLLELQCVRRELEQLVEDAKRGDVLRQGLQVALVGRPNVGKSSLLNRLSRRERAIVTDLPGTTRDVLESEIVLEGVPITLVDTAGIRATQDALEQLGIDRSHQALAAADVAVLVFDLSLGWTADDAALLAQIPDDLPRLLVGNKADLQPASMAASLMVASLGNEVDGKTVDVMLSALTGQGEEALIKAVLKTCGASEAQGLVVALNQRQQDLAAAAAIALARTQEAAEHQLPWDFWTIDLRQAISSLGEITGEEITEAVLDRIFSRFCIGK